MASTQDELNRGAGCFVCDLSLHAGQNVSGSEPARPGIPVPVSTPEIIAQNIVI
jgi:hypothetical protein